MADTENERLRVALATLCEAYAALVAAGHAQLGSHRTLRFSWGRGDFEEAGEAEQYTDFSLCLDPTSPEFFEAIPVPNSFGVNLWIQWKQDDPNVELSE